MPADHDEIPRVFVTARGHLLRAQEARDRINALWNSIPVDDAIAAWIHTRPDLARELWCSFRIPHAIYEQLELASGKFLKCVKAALDAAVLSTAWTTYGIGDLVKREHHTMPLCASPDEFESLPYEDHLMGLRPDQVDVVRHFQPFSSDARGFIGHHMTHLALALETMDRGESLFAAWAGSASPQTLLPEDCSVVSTALDKPGLVGDAKRLATFRLAPDHPDVHIKAKPRVPFDPIWSVGPWPINSDDNLSRRTGALVSITRHLIRSLERSSRPESRLDELVALEESIPAVQAPVWLPVHFEDSNEETEVRAAIDESERGMATYRMTNGTLTYVRLRAGRVVGREIHAPARLQRNTAYGDAVEHATRSAAARWSLPDFVLQPKVVPKGSGIREVGDGTILSGSRGIALQVKSRGTTGDSPERATKWLLKNAGVGLRQARGTIRTTLGVSRVALTNLRGREINVAGRTIDWVPVVVLDHEHIPLRVVPEPDGKGPSLFLSRQDWEFLWAQLRSATAIVDYVHRVAGEEPIELGAETNRYFDLAERDWNAPPNPLPSWIARAGGGESSHLPTLPRDPADSADELGHEIFQRIMEDIAETQFTGDESRRVQMLSLVDQVAVAARADLGRLLLRRLIDCTSAPEHEFRVLHRLMYINDGELHLSFTTMTQLTGYQRQLFQTWLLHRRQRFLTESNAQGPIYPWTMGVLLTPRPTDSRLWDTTTIATNGPPHFESVEYDRLTRVYDSFGAAPRPYRGGEAMHDGTCDD